MTDREMLFYVYGSLQASKLDDKLVEMLGQHLFSKSIGQCLNITTPAARDRFDPSPFSEDDWETHR